MRLRLRLRGDAAGSAPPPPASHGPAAVSGRFPAPGVGEGGDPSDKGPGGTAEPRSRAAPVLGPAAPPAAAPCPPPRADASGRRAEGGARLRSAGAGRRLRAVPVPSPPSRGAQRCRRRGRAPCALPAPAVPLQWCSRLTFLSLSSGSAGPAAASPSAPRPPPPHAAAPPGLGPASFLPSLPPTRCPPGGPPAPCPPPTRLQRVYVCVCGGGGRGDSALRCCWGEFCWGVWEAAHGDVAASHAGFGAGQWPEPVARRPPGPAAGPAPHSPPASHGHGQTCGPALRMNPHVHLRSKPH